MNTTRLIIKRLTINADALCRIDSRPESRLFMEGPTIYILNVCACNKPDNSIYGPKRQHWCLFHDCTVRYISVCTIIMLSTRHVDRRGDKQSFIGSGVTLRKEKKEVI